MQNLYDFVKQIFVSFPKEKIHMFQLHDVWVSTVNDVDNDKIISFCFLSALQTLVNCNGEYTILLGYVCHVGMFSTWKCWESIHLLIRNDILWLFIQLRESVERCTRGLHHLSV